MADVIVKEGSVHLRNAVGHAARRADDFVDEIVEGTEGLSKQLEGIRNLQAANLQMVVEEFERQVRFSIQHQHQHQRVAALEICAVLHALCVCVSVAPCKHSYACAQTYQRMQFTMDVCVFICEDQALCL
jgi:hypothetical protein